MTFGFSSHPGLMRVHSHTTSTTGFETGIRTRDVANEVARGSMVCMTEPAEMMVFQSNTDRFSLSVVKLHLRDLICKQSPSVIWIRIRSDWFSEITVENQGPGSLYTARSVS
uniref:Uncharacterized protein n=1 Tax=Schistocephalus solidus TaxID=70667 RepID=A0A0X3P0C6_SCHSO